MHLTTHQEPTRGDVQDKRMHVQAEDSPFGLSNGKTPKVAQKSIQQVVVLSNKFKYLS